MAPLLKWTRDESVASTGDFFYTSQSHVVVVGGRRFGGSWTIRRNYQSGSYFSNAPGGWVAQFDAWNGDTPLGFTHPFSTLAEAKRAAAIASDNAR